GRALAGTGAAPCDPRRARLGRGACADARSRPQAALSSVWAPSRRRLEEDRVLVGLEEERAHGRASVALPRAAGDLVAVEALQALEGLSDPAGDALPIARLGEEAASLVHELRQAA